MQNERSSEVVVFGGANGTSLVLLGLKEYQDIHLSAVVSMSDSGRSSRIVREELKQLPVADILRVLMALSKYDFDLLKEIFYKKRFETEDKLNGLNIGSLMIALSANYCGDLVSTIDALGKIFEIHGKVFPATLDMTDLNVELSDGTQIHGEGEIDEPHNRKEGLLIQRAWLERSGRLYDGAKKAITSADVIVIGPGDLYTSNIASLLADGTYQAIAQSHAKILYFAGNKYSLSGEYAPQNLSARVEALEKYLPRKLDVVVYNDHILSQDEQSHYEEKEWGVLSFDVENLPSHRVFGFDVEKSGGGIDHHALGKRLYDIIREKI